MATLNQSDLRIVTKMVQILRNDYDLKLHYQDPDLAQKIGAHVLEQNDPVLSALWQSLSVEFRAAGTSSPTSSPESKTAEADSSVRMYRGQTIIQEKPGNTKQASADEPPEQNKSSGHYVIYRGKKTWVPK